ncbi:MAG: hypothetical protein JL50_11050 [Peptococcaceae bacterium BICA1-7]|nr:MAG: hypothetical protein JL50_11050 [Peptococcaceae bacterium BICA1-7]HBV95823.1 hypothetical protein [Desulfotomaculum sp.]
MVEVNFNLHLAEKLYVRVFHAAVWASVLSVNPEVCSVAVEAFDLMAFYGEHGISSLTVPPACCIIDLDKYF